MREHIYCDYEEDVFRHNLLNHKAHFKQMKLYSKNFSFASDEVKKALAHFFMLYVKGEYTFDELEFIFESNSDVAQRKGNNYADLLRAWFTNQENLSPELLNEIIPVVRRILDKYVEDRIDSPDEEEKPAMQKAAGNFKRLTDGDIGDFIKKIKWNFSDVEPDVALNQIREKVRLLAQALPVSGNQANLGMLIYRLHYEVWLRTTQTAVVDKVLTDDLLDKLVLQIGSEKDQEYEFIFNRCEHAELTYFLPGEFYEIVDATEYCRSKNFLAGQDHVWKLLLSSYLKFENLPQQIRRKAIYELCLLSLRNDFDTFLPTGSLFGLEAEITKYFSSGEFSVDEITDAFTLLTMVSTSVLWDLVKIKSSQIEEWQKALNENISALLGVSKNLGDICTLLEIRGHSNYINNGFNAEYLIDDFKKIVSLLNDADTFPTLEFYDKLNLIIAQSIRFGGKHADRNIEIFQEILAEVEPISIAREGGFKIAKSLINIGYTYLQRKEPRYLLKAIQEFQKAKDHYKASESMEGYVLALMNIGQVYTASGMLYAGKYYVLCAIWRVIQTNRPELDKRLADAMTLLIHVDFSAGAWLSVLDDFLPYLNFHVQFKTPERGPFEDERLHKVLNMVAITIAGIPVIEPGLTEHVNSRTQQLGWIYDEALKNDVENHKQMFEDPEYLQQSLNFLLTDKPLNELGKRREVSFYALGIKWTVVFNNDFSTQAAGEQFCSILQIALTELASVDFDFNFLVAPVKILLAFSDTPQAPTQMPSNEEFIWKVYVQEQKTNTVEEIQEIYGRMLTNVSVVLHELSLLKKEEFFPLYTEFLEKRQVKQKTLVEHGYARIYQEIFDQAIFDEPKRAGFVTPKLAIELPKLNDVMSQRKDLSNKYDHELSLKHIKTRYDTTIKHFHLTLDHYNDEYFFLSWIKELRDAGWLDWHICAGLMNAVLSIKANDLVAKRTYKTHEARAEAFQNLFQKSFAGTEDDNFKVIPLERLMSAFDTEMELYKVRFLQSFGLFDKPKFPNFDAAATFVKDRLQFFNDDIPELSPLKDIAYNLSEGAIRNSIEGFGFFIMAQGKPPIFHFQMSNQLHAKALADEFRKKFYETHIGLQITDKGNSRFDVFVEGANGEKFIVENIPLVDDLKSKVKNYTDGDAEQSMIAPSFREDNLLQFAAIQKPLAISKLVIDY